MPSTKDYHLIDSTGKILPIGFTEILKKPIVAVVGQPDSTSFYFLDESKKDLVISAWIISNDTGIGKISSGSIPWHEPIYGTFQDQANLYLISSVKKSKTPKLTHIEGLKVVRQTEFDIAVELSDYHQGAVSFHETGLVTPAAVSIAHVKIIKSKNLIWVVADDQFDVLTARYRKSYHTVVSRLDLTSGKSVSREFPQYTPNYFGSTVFDNHLCRLTIDNGFKVEFFHFDTGKRSYTYHLNNTMSFSKDTIYVDVNNPVEKKADATSLISSTDRCFIMADSLPDGETVLTLGTYTFSEYRAGVPLGTFVYLITSAASKPTIYRTGAKYLYAKGSIEKGFRLTNDVNFLQRHMAEYEYKTKRSPYYIIGKQCIYGLSANSDKKSDRSIDVVKFEY